MDPDSVYEPVSFEYPSFAALFFWLPLSSSAALQWNGEAEAPPDFL